MKKTFKIDKKAMTFANGEYFTDMNFAIKRNLIKTNSELFNNALYTGVNCKYDNGSLLKEHETTLPNIDALMARYRDSYNLKTDELAELNLYRKPEKSSDLMHLFYSANKNLIVQIDDRFAEVFRNASGYLNIKNVKYYQFTKLGAVGVFFDGDFVGAIMPCENYKNDLTLNGLELVSSAEVNDAGIEPAKIL